MSPRRQRLTSLVITGVAGAGKSTLLAALADRLGWPAAEGDAMHPAANVAKMAAGIALDDADRWPWLAQVAAWIGDREAERRSSIITCSALRRSYRDLLRQGHPSVWFVQLVAPRALVEDRLKRRTGHFMPPSLLPSQLHAFEQLERDEPGSIVDAGPSADVIADQLIADLRLERVSGIAT